MSREDGTDVVVRVEELVQCSIFRARILSKKMLNISRYVGYLFLLMSFVRESLSRESTWGSFDMYNSLQHLPLMSVRRPIALEHSKMRKEVFLDIT